MIKKEFPDGTFYNDDCLKVFPTIPEGSVDMILADLPYGTTENPWDNIIPYEELWPAYWRVLKPNGVIVLTAQTPFDKTLGMSQIQYLKYEWIWYKSRKTGFLNAKKMPMKSHENVLVFYKNLPTYNPQGVKKINKVCIGGKNQTPNYGKMGIKPGEEFIQEYTNYPHSVLEFTSVTATEHPTQKPIDLFAYLIRTYTNEGETVLDNTAGSGTTAFAARQTNRKWICMEMDSKYYNQAIEKLDLFLEFD